MVHEIYSMVSCRCHYMRCVCDARGKNTWLIKFFALYIEGMHQLWLEWCNIFHEYTMSKIRVEDHHALLTHFRRLYRVLGIDDNSVLWKHKEKLSSLSTSNLRGVVYEKYSFARDEGWHERLNYFIWPSHKHKRMELSEELLEFRNDASRSRHLSRKMEQDYQVDI